MRGPGRLRARDALLLALLLVLARGLRAQAETAPFPRRGEYAGVAACVKCHERQHRLLLRGAHRAVLASDVLPGCETCHGPGKAHADDEGDDLTRITMPARLAGDRQVAFCGRCHADQVAGHGGDLPGLRQAGKVCTDCHEVHARPAAPVLPGVRMRARADAAAMAQPIGSRACVACHPRRDALLAASDHASLSAAHADGGCETCHGPGSLHERTNGQSRLITRPDRAEDGVATCRRCHPAVDAAEFHWRGRHKPYLSEGVTCATCHVVHAARAGAGAPAQPAAPAAAAAATNRVCAACHAPALCTMPGSVHRQLGGLDVPLADGCDRCHAGGLAHAQAHGRGGLVQNVRDAPAAEQARICLACHRQAEALQHVHEGSHERHGVGCVRCHAPLHDTEPLHAGSDAERACRDCHAEVAAQFLLPNHHPVPEGRMRCASCHDVHGARPRARDRELTEQRCVGCHARYRGPFVFAHQAGRIDGCVTCHLPHGSGNRRLLQQATTQQNCLQCHGDFPAFHDQTPGSVFTNCIRCHTEVHGSNHARFLFR